MRSIRGFTLVELMVTVIVIAILAAMAAPAFADFFQRYRLRGAADDIATLMATARADAIARNRDVAIVFSGSGTAWCVGAATAAEPAAGEAVSTAPSCNCSNDCRVGGQVMETRAANYNGVSMTNTPTGFVFDRRNGSKNPLPVATATLQSPNQAYSLAVQVSALGRANLCVPSGKKDMAGFKSCAQ